MRVQRVTAAAAASGTHDGGAIYNTYGAAEHTTLPRHYSQWFPPPPSRGPESSRARRALLGAERHSRKSVPGALERRMVPEFSSLWHSAHGVTHVS